jgi:hypothetical protein
MRNRQLKWRAAAIAASGIVTLGAPAAAVTGQQEQRATAGGLMSMGQTTTESLAPSTPATSLASPKMKAPKPKGF